MPSLSARSTYSEVACFQIWAACQCIRSLASREQQNHNHISSMFILSCLISNICTNLFLEIHSELLHCEFDFKSGTSLLTLVRQLRIIFYLVLIVITFCLLLEAHIITCGLRLIKSDGCLTLEVINLMAAVLLL